MRKKVVRHYWAIKDDAGLLVVERGPLPALYRLKKKARSEMDPVSEALVRVRVTLEEVGEDR